MITLPPVQQGVTSPSAWLKVQQAWSDGGVGGGCSNIVGDGGRDGDDGMIVMITMTG